MAFRLKAALPGALRMRRGFRQRRFWELRDDPDHAVHVDYCHINPVKHGYVQRTADWPHSTFHCYVVRGVYPLNWANRPTGDVEARERG